MKTNPTATTIRPRRRTPRYMQRDVPYRPPRDARERGGDLRLIVEFGRRYLWPYRRRISLLITLATLSACSAYLMAFYGKVVVDDILVVQQGGSLAATQDTAPTARHQTTPTHRLYDDPSQPSLHENLIPSRSHNAQTTDLKSQVVPERAASGRVSERFRDANSPQRPPFAGLRLFSLFLIYLTTVILLNIASRISNRSRVRVATQMTLVLRDDLHRKILSLSSRYHQAATPGRLMARILSDVDMVRRHLLDVVQTITSQTIMFLVGVGIMASLDIYCTIAVLVAMVPYSWAMRENRRRRREVNREMRHTNSCLWGLVSQKLDAIRAIFAYGREKTEQINFLRLSAVLQRDTIEQERLGASIGRSAQLIATLTCQGIFIYCATKVLDGQMTLGSMMYIFGAASNLFNPVIQLTNLTNQISSLLVVLQRMTLTLENPNVILDAPDAVPFPSPLKTGISLENLSFQYDEDGARILNHIDLDIPAGRWLCIMGPSGAGKTTLVNLLARLYEPTEGRILLDNIPLSKIRVAELRNHLAMVPQEAQIISGTVRANITYGHTTATPAEIMRAAQAADCHNFVMDMPVQYETAIGEKGMTLSGGQRQRISIARALLTSPEVLVLDDCTSALDANTERKIQETLTNLLKGKTAIIVSQRVSMAMRCHNIIVLQDGSITERGTHEQLLQRGGFYARLHTQQTSAS